MVLITRRLAICSVLLFAACRGDNRADDPCTTVAPAAVAWRPLPPPDPSAQIGTPHILEVEASARSGRWVVACQARDLTPDAVNRDRNRLSASWHLVPYLFRGGGPGEAIDQLMAVSRDDRWLVALRADQLVLIDDIGQRETTLPATAVEVSGRSRYVVAFDADATHLVYLQVTGGGTKVVIRTLASQAERAVQLPGEVVVGVVPEPVGHWARLWFRGPTGADPSFVKHAPTVSREEAAKIGLTDEIRARRASCGYRPAPPWQFGLEAVQAWLDLDTGAVRRDPDVLARLGDVEIQRTRDGALWSRGAELVPASCKARVLGLSTRPLRILRICQTGEDRVPLEIFGPGLHATTGAIPARQPNLSVRFFEGAYACVFQRTCVALRDGSAVALGDAEPLAWGTHVLAVDGRGLFFPTGPHPEERYLTSLGGQESAGAIHASGRAVLDLAAAHLLGYIAPAPLAITDTGQGLVPAVSAVDGPTLDSWPIGPMHWVAPRQ
jgi:hypothetical protein